MHKFLLFFIGSVLVLLLNSTSYAQDAPAKDSVSQINVKLINIFNQKTPSKYKIRNIKVVGNENFDENLLLSLSTLNIGDEITLPGGENFGKAIHKLMDQNYFSDVSIWLTDLVGNEIDVEIAVVERPRLSKFNFIGVRKSEIDELVDYDGTMNNSKYPPINWGLTQKNITDKIVPATRMPGNPVTRGYRRYYGESVTDEDKIVNEVDLVKALKRKIISGGDDGSENANARPPASDSWQ